MDKKMTSGEIAKLKIIQNFGIALSNVCKEVCDE